MAIGLKLDIEFSGPEGERATFGDLRRFVDKAQAGGVADDDELLLELDERDDLKGIALFLNPNV